MRHLKDHYLRLLQAFASGKKLSRKEVDEIQQMIDDFREEADD